MKVQEQHILRAVKKVEKLYKRDYPIETRDQAYVEVQYLGVHYFDGETVYYATIVWGTADRTFTTEVAINNIAVRNLPMYIYGWLNAIEITN